MEIDWGAASRIGGVGFAMVFVVLLILAGAIWLVGRIIGRMERDKEKSGDEKKGA